MAKCIECKQCLDIVYLDLKRYLRCPICLQWYVTLGPTKLEKIEDPTKGALTKFYESNESS